MAKKRRLSKRDRKIKMRMQSYKSWPEIMHDADFNKRLSELLYLIDPSLSGMLSPDKEVLKYYTFDEGGVSNVYYVAFLSKDGADVADEPLPMIESTF